MSTTHPLSDRLENLETRLQKYANRHATDRVPASDLFQIAVEEILTNCSPTDNDTYMLRLADWRMRNAVKRERVYLVRIDQFDITEETDSEDGIQIKDGTNDPEEEVISRENTSKIQNIIRELKPEHAKIIELLSEGKNPHDIAEVVGTTRQNIEYHIRKIRETFKQAGLIPSFA